MKKILFPVFKTFMADGMIQVYSMFAETTNTNMTIVDWLWNSLWYTHRKIKTWSRSLPRPPPLTSD